MSATDTVLKTMKQLPALLDAIAAASSLTGASPAVGKYLTLASALLRAGSKAYDELHSLTKLVNVMVHENREPTDDEWASLAIRSKIAHEAIQGYDIDKE